MQKALKAYRDKRLIEPVKVRLRPKADVVFYQIVMREWTETVSGQMLLIQLSHKRDLADPAVDIAGLVGNATVVRKSGIQDPMSPEIWFWNDKFWTKARGAVESVYYNNHQYLFYEIEVEDPEGLMAKLTVNY